MISQEILEQFIDIQRKDRKMKIPVASLAHTLQHMYRGSSKDRSRIPLMKVSKMPEPYRTLVTAAYENRDLSGYMMALLMNFAVSWHSDISSDIDVDVDFLKFLVSADPNSADLPPPKPIDPKNLHSLLLDMGELIEDVLPLSIEWSKDKKKFSIEIPEGESLFSCMFHEVDPSK